MYYELARRCVLATAGSPGYSPPVSMEGANAARIEYIIFSISGTSTFYLEGSNDGENWFAIATYTTRSAVGSYTDASTGISYRYVRVKYEQTTSGTTIFACGCNTAQL
ncbi:MAG: hypothetical protein JNM84_08275 [Planctomycetes bacterium]|nr:hypothetical protein [Planctomycetota bacterium]